MSDSNEQSTAVAPRVVSEPPALAGQTPGARPVTPTPVLHSSEGVVDIITALCAAQGKFKTVVKDRTAQVQRRDGGAGYTYSYATLASVIAAVRPALNENGIALVQSANIIQTDRAVMLQVDTRFVHTSGQWVGSVLRLPLGDATPQGLGSLMTYLRRYGLSALAGVASDEDDDAQLAQALTPDQPPTARRSHHKAPTPPPQPGPPTMGETMGEKPKPAPKAAAAPLSSKPDAITSKDRALLFKTAKQHSWTEADVKSLIKQLFDYDSTSQLTAVQLGTVLGSIETPGDYGVSFEDLEGVRVVVVRKAEQL